MKFYSFLPGFLIIGLIVVLLTLDYYLHLNIPVLRNIKQPALFLLLFGVLLCGFGTTGHGMFHLFKSGFNIYTIILILTGLTIAVIAAARFIFKYPIFGISSTAQTFTILLSLILFKVIISTVRMITWTNPV